MRGICVHAHFYQPPREDPWLGEVLLDPSAAPYHDWNSRIAAQCYHPNRAARLVDGGGRILSICNNYRHLSFDFGPTLHRWIEKHEPLLDENIQEADRFALENSGSGNALAQAYVHMILPLASGRDKFTQVRWGIADFQKRFGRFPQGMWLPEAAVDTPTLESLAQNGIIFTILSPTQCAAVRSPGGSWVSTPQGAGLDVFRPYRIMLPSGRTMTLLFYHADISRDIAFGNLLDNGDRLAERLAQTLPPDGEEPRLLVVATDGETFGHHHPFGEMALARAFQLLCASKDTLLTNIEAFLKKSPVTWEARIVERSSWSCPHGVERWKSDCGCHTGGEPGWNQAWRAPLREAFDRLRDRLDASYEEGISDICNAPWLLRDESVLFQLEDFSHSKAERLLARQHFLEERFGKLTPEASEKLLTWLEIQRMRLFMYTSCGWFFNDLAGLETLLVLSFAFRAAELADKVTGRDFSTDLIDDLEKAKGNRPELSDGKIIMEKKILPKKRSLLDMAASASLMEASGDYYDYDVKSDIHSLPSGGLSLKLSRLSIADSRMGSRWSGSAAILSSGGFDDVCQLTEDGIPNEKELRHIFYERDLLHLSTAIKERFPLGSWLLSILPPDDKEHLAAQRNRAAEISHLQMAEDILEDNQRLLVHLHHMQVTPPPFLLAAARLVLQEQIQELFKKTPSALALLTPNSPLEPVLERAHAIGLSPELSDFSPRVADELLDLLHQIRSQSDPSNLANLADLFLQHWRRLKELEIHIESWELQNMFWSILESPLTQTHSTLIALAGEMGFATPSH